MIIFKELIEKYDFFLLDAYGVFWGSAEMGMLPGTKETMEYLVAQGKHVGILSNSTQLALKEKEKLAKHGVKEGTHYHFLLTSGEVARELLLSGELPFRVPRKTYSLFGADHPRFSAKGGLFQESGYRQAATMEEADFIYISVPHLEGVDQVDPEVFAEEVKKIANKGIPVFCANPDHFAHEGHPSRFVVRQGKIAQMLQAHGALVSFVGKPFPTVYERALHLFPRVVRWEEVLMVGDTPETDIRGGRQMGMATALVTQTGVMRERSATRTAAEVINQLPLSDQPDYAIKGFALDGL